MNKSLIMILQLVILLASYSYKSQFSCNPRLSSMRGPKMLCLWMEVIILPVTIVTQYHYAQNI